MMSWPSTTYVKFCTTETAIASKWKTDWQQIGMDRQVMMISCAKPNTNHPQSTISVARMKSRNFLDPGANWPSWGSWIIIPCSEEQSFDHPTDGHFCCYTETLLFAEWVKNGQDTLNPWQLVDSKSRKLFTNCSTWRDFWSWNHGHSDDPAPARSWMFTLCGSGSGSKIPRTPKKCQRNPQAGTQHPQHPQLPRPGTVKTAKVISRTNSSVSCEKWWNMVNSPGKKCWKKCRLTIENMGWFLGWLRYLGWFMVVPFNELICAVATPIHRFIKFRHLEIVEEISPKTCWNTVWCLLGGAVKEILQVTLVCLSPKQGVYFGISLHGISLHVWVPSRFFCCLKSPVYEWRSSSEWSRCMMWFHGVFSMGLIITKWVTYFLNCYSIYSTRFFPTSVKE